jgi:hypothetical protein
MYYWFPVFKGMTWMPACAGMTLIWSMAWADGARAGQYFHPDHLGSYVKVSFYHLKAIFYLIS